MLLLFGAGGGGATVVGLFSRTSVSLGVSTTRFATWSCWPFQVACTSMPSMVPVSTSGGFDEPCGQRVNVFGLEVGVEWSERCVARIDGPALPLSETVPSPGSWADTVKGNDFCEGKVFCLEGELVVGATRSSRHAGRRLVPTVN